MEWLPVGTITTDKEYVYTPVVSGSLFKLKHIRTNPVIKSLKIVIRQAFEEQGVLAFFDYKLISYKTELDIILFALPNGLTNRKLAIKRADGLLQEDWSIEIEQMNIVEDGINLPINISDVTNLQLQLDNIQAELTAKALDLDFDTHVLATNNPHNVTTSQIGAESIGTGASLITSHELSVNHPLVSANDKGLMSIGDKSKLDSIQNFATVNSTDTYLLDRGKHLGEQAISTIVGLLTALDSKEPTITTLPINKGGTNSNTRTWVDLSSDETIGGIKSFSGNSLNLNNSISAAFVAGSAGVALPSFTSRSVGTKFILRQATGTSTVDYAIGVAGATVWFAIPSATTTFKFSWFAGITEIASLRGDGLYTVQKLIVSSVNAWIPLPIVPAWANVGTPSATAAYRKLPDGTIELKGAIKKATAAVVNEIMFTLPALHRPLETRHHITISNNGVGGINILNNGDATFQVGSNVSVSLEGIRFIAEQ